MFTLLYAQVPPSDTKVDEECSPDQLAKDRARLTAELADAKKKFMAVAKRKQQEYTKKVNSLPERTVTPDLKGFLGCPGQQMQVVTCIGLNPFCFPMLLALAGMKLGD